MAVQCAFSNLDMIFVHFLLLGALPTCAAWGCEGHEIVATIAQSRLSPRAFQQISRLLPEENGNLSRIACWADDVRREPNYKWSIPLHFVNTPDWFCNYQYERDCPGGRCAVGAILNYTQKLQESTTNREIQVEALKFITHIVGDLHQPLHVAFTGDKGGLLLFVEWNTNSPQAVLEDATGTELRRRLVLSSQKGRKSLLPQESVPSARTTRPAIHDDMVTYHIHSSLHEVWDNEFVRETLNRLRERGEWHELATQLLQKFNVTPDSETPWQSCPRAPPSSATSTFAQEQHSARGFHDTHNPSQQAGSIGTPLQSHSSGVPSVLRCADSWATESIHLACTDAYVNGRGGEHMTIPLCIKDDPCYLNATYYHENLSVVERQLVKGGVRLADLLNRIFAA